VDLTSVETDTASVACVSAIIMYYNNKQKLICVITTIKQGWNKNIRQGQFPRHIYEF
jgi:hypothetical protein